jgi:two-component system, chemotaxis family, chemotaxis protein CheY
VTRDIRANIRDTAANERGDGPGIFDRTLRRPRAEITDHVTAPTILIVDDDPDMRIYLRGCLRALGEAAGAVIDAADGVEALRRVRADGVGLVISDVVLPRMDGLELRQAIRGDPVHARLPILLISGEPEKALLSGPADAYLSKPFNARELLAAVRDLMNLNHEVHP